MRWLLVVAILGGCDVIWRLDRVPEPPEPSPLVGRWAHVDGGYGATCALDNDQHLWCWGSNGNGELGLASAVPENTVVQQVGDETWSSISTMYVDTCGVQTNGTLWCWGYNYYGQLGIGSTVVARAPQQVGIETWREVSAGPYHTCGIRDDGTAWCWGRNAYGELGDGDTADAMLPVQ